MKGPEGSDPETTSYFINHMALTVNDLNRSLDFYTSVFGMRHMFTYQLTEHVSFTYMGHSAGGRNGTGYQTTEELIRYKNNGYGRIELVHLSTPKKEMPGPDVLPSTLNHIGIIVPNTTATQERLQKKNVRILKKVGESMPKDGPLANPYFLGDASKLHPKEFATFQDMMTEVNKFNIFALDPDGNLLEILPEDEGNMFG
jgi:lactoylglutathione lyase